MRNFQSLNQSSLDSDSGLLMFSVATETETQPTLALRREGGYVAISASHGPLEIALRPRYEEMVRKLARLQPIKGLQTTRQIGTAQAYLAVGLHEDGMLLIRPTIVGDATGHLSFNFSLENDQRKTLYEWLAVEENDTD